VGPQALHLEAEKLLAPLLDAPTPAGRAQRIATDARGRLGGAAP